MQVRKFVPILNIGKDNEVAARKSEGKYQLEDTEVDGMIISKYILNK
jgi:hypothetical protein